MKNLCKHLVLPLLLFYSGRCLAQSDLDRLDVRARVQAVHQRFYSLYSADFDRARELAEWSVRVSVDSAWKSEEAGARLDLGVITYLSGRYDEVLPQYIRALQLYDSLLDDRGVARVNNEMAVFHHKQSDLERALACLAESERRARKIGDLEQLGTSLGHHGAFLSVRGRYDEAYPFYLEVLDIRTRLKDSVGLGYVYADMAEYHGHKGDLEKARSFLEQSTTIRMRLGDRQGVAVNHVNTGEMYFNAGDYAAAAKWLRRGLDEALLIGFKDLARHTYDFLAKTYVAQGDFRQAYLLQSTARKYSDSLINAEKTKVIEELQARYEAERKDHEISRLSQDNMLQQATIQKDRWTIGALLLALLVTVLAVWVWRSMTRIRENAWRQEQEIRSREAQMRAVVSSQEHERSRFAADLHDGVGQQVTALQLNIRSVRDAQPSAGEWLVDAEQQLADIHQEIRSTAFNLMPPVLKREGIVAAVAQLADRVGRSSGRRISVHAHGMRQRLSEEQEISLYRILQEWLSNILRHNSASRITIGFTAHEQEVCLTVEDDGHGFDPESFRASVSGSGWRNIQVRLGLMRASWEIDSRPGRPNTTVTIRLPFQAGGDEIVAST